MLNKLIKRIKLLHNAALDPKVRDWDDSYIADFLICSIHELVDEYIGCKGGDIHEKVSWFLYGSVSKKEVRKALKKARKSEGKSAGRVE